LGLRKDKSKQDGLQIQLMKMRQICQPPDGLGFFESSTKKCRIKIKKDILAWQLSHFNSTEKEQGGDTRKN
jgi:hypothetical protein